MENKIIISKDWRQKAPKKTSRISRARVSHQFQQVEVIRSEDLPELLTMDETAEFFKVERTTVERWIASGDLESFKIKGRRFVTPEQIGEFIDSEYRKNG